MIQVGYNYGSLAEMIERYPPSEMREGLNDNGEETVFFISNPGHGLWMAKERLMQEHGVESENIPGCAVVNDGVASAPGGYDASNPAVTAEVGDVVKVERLPQS